MKDFDEARTCRVRNHVRGVLLRLSEHQKNASEPQYNHINGPILETLDKPGLEAVDKAGCREPDLYFSA